ncbi:hypothetical protein QA612_09780 [Evansella sp. AB-P1]|nr:hypothetical protein [Evansella sp. AB-P1]MDG5787789.1 hypothetical protein [Evansella sp. AB-P1]
MALNVGGIVQDTLKIVYGNPDVMVFIFSFTIVVTLVFVTIELYNKSRL